MKRQKDATTPPPLQQEKPEDMNATKINETT